jgi:hypothetical protein
LGKFFPIGIGLRTSIKHKKSLKSGICDIVGLSSRLAPELLSFRTRGESGGPKNAVDIGSGFVVSIEGWVSAATAAGGQIAELASRFECYVKGDRL